MRECIYCGKQLEKGEVCMCATSVAKRRERERKAEAERPKTKQELKREARDEKAKRKEQAKERTRQEKEQRRNTGYGNTAFNGRTSFNGNTFRGGFGGMNRSVSGNPFVNIWRLLVGFIKSPIETVMNPGRMGVAEILIMVTIEGIICGLCGFAIITGSSRGILSQIGNAMGFGGAEGFGMLQFWLRAALSGAISGLAIFFVYSGVFFAVSRLIFRQFIPYWDFVKRFVFVEVPVTVVGIVGTILGLFSFRTFIVLLVCGLAGAVILTYELLRSMWSSKSAVRVMYTMLICMFVFFTVMVNLASLL